MDTTNIKNFGQSIANPNDKETYRRYINEIMKYKPLSREEEFELFVQIKDGDERAVDKICRHNLLFVVSIAKRYAALIGKSNLTLEDLIGEGNLGICIAAKRFDNTSGNKFISYAVWWIKQCILECIGKNIKNIRLPINITGSIKKLREMERNLEQKLGRDVTSIELFEAMADEGMDALDSETKIDDWYRMSNFEYSLDVIIDEDSSPLSDRVKCNDNDAYMCLEVKERYELLDKMMSKIPNFIQDYIKDFYGLDGRKPMTLKAMGEKYDESPSTIKIRIDKTLKRMRSNNRDSTKFFFPAIENYGQYYRQRGWNENTRVLI